MTKQTHKEIWEIKETNKNQFTILRNNHIITTTKNKTKAIKLITKAIETIIFEENKITISYSYNN